MIITRRETLKTLGLSAGATFLHPIVSRLEAQAAGKPITAKRFVFVVESNGVRPEQLAPSGITRKSREQRALNGSAELVDVSLTDRDLPFSLEPIKTWKDKVTIVQGLSGRVCGRPLQQLRGAWGLRCRARSRR